MSTPEAVLPVTLAALVMFAGLYAFTAGAQVSRRRKRDVAALHTVLHVAVVVGVVDLLLLLSGVAAADPWMRAVLGGVVDSSIRYFESFAAVCRFERSVRTNTPRFAEDPRIGSAVLGGMLENPAAALAVSGERRESVTLDIGAFVPVSAAALTLVDAAGRDELAGPECCAVLCHEGVLLVRGSWCRGAGMIGLPAA